MKRARLMEYEWMVKYTPQTEWIEECYWRWFVQARTYFRKRQEYYPGQGLTEFEKLAERLYPLQTGTATKCNFCMERIDQGLRRGLTPGKDREATPACVIICPAKARYFGDLDDPSSEISLLVRKWRAEPLRPEHGTKPPVYYAC